jgi:hypothetical protein
MQSVNSQDYIQDQLASSGASPMLGGVLTHSNMEQIAKKLGLELAQDAPKFDPIFKTLGVRSSDVITYWYRNVAQKPMWWWSDFLLTQQFLEHQELGHSLQGSALQSHKFISDYRMPTAMGQNVLPDRVGRFLAQSATDPAVLMFGRYRYGLARSVANMAKTMVSPNATKAERTQVVGNLLAMTALSTAVWPIINYGLQKVTGNPDAELDPVGLQREGRTIKNAYGPDADKDIGDIFRGVAQPAPMIGAFSDLVNNKDWKGDPVVVRGQTFTPKGAAQLGSFAAHQIAPVNTVATAAAAARGSPSDMLGRVLAAQSGIKIPTEKAQAYKGKIESINTKMQKQREKKADPIESGINSLMGQ